VISTKTVSKSQIRFIMLQWKIVSSYNTWRFCCLMYSHTFLTATVRDTSEAPTKLPSSEETGTAFCMPVLVLAIAGFFAAGFAAAPPDGAAFTLAALFAAAAMNALPAVTPKTLVSAIFALRKNLTLELRNPRAWVRGFRLLGSLLLDDPTELFYCYECVHLVVTWHIFIG